MPTSRLAVVKVAAELYSALKDRSFFLRLDELHETLMKLPHIGARGFEGFVRDALVEITGQRFRLMKSGPQGGVDVIGEPDGNGLVIGLEGKQYASATRLPLDALKSKLRDASDEFQSLDLWLLATTRAISGGDNKALVTLGDELGIDVLVLDWDAEAATPPDLAILCAAAPETVREILKPTDAVREAIASIGAHVSFSARQAALRERLTNPSVGLASTRAFLSNWTHRKMRSRADARAAFDSFAALERPGAHRILRPRILEPLDAWWSQNATAPAVLLGSEGTGKTWAALAWWIERSDDQTLPLTLVVPARDVIDQDAPALIARTLFKVTGKRTEAFWRAKVRRWSQIPSPGPALLLIIDGLNQNWQFNRWSDLVNSLQTSEWGSKVAILLTCRPDHWNNRLKGLGDLERLPKTVAVDPFDDAELDALLSKHGLMREELASSVIQLMRIPRLSALVIEQRANLTSDEVTPERVVYEDWRHRHPGAQQVLDHGEFRDFVTTLGQSLRQELGTAQLSRAELLTRLADASGRPESEFEGVLSELIDGGWLQPGNKRHQFRIDATKVPAALGLALIAELTAASIAEERDQRFASLMDPLQGSDLSVDILGHAATYALVDLSTPTDLKLLLIREWAESQNFGLKGFESYWRLIGVAPEIFLDVAERDWFLADSRSSSTEALQKGVSNAWRWQNVRDAVELLSLLLKHGAVPHWIFEAMSEPDDRDLAGLEPLLSPDRPALEIVTWLEFLMSFPKAVHPLGWPPLEGLSAAKHQPGAADADRPAPELGASTPDAGILGHGIAA